MPVFNGSANNLATQVQPGDTVTLFAASDTLTAPAVSTVIAPVDAGPVERSCITFQAHFASTPTASLTIKGSNFPPTSAGPQNGITIGAAITTQNAAVVDTAGYAFYWASLDSQSAGGAVTVIAHVR
jgi:hypothetical protein